MNIKTFTHCVSLPMRLTILAALALGPPVPAPAQTPPAAVSAPPAWKDLGGPRFGHWTGLKPAPANAPLSGTAAWSLTDAAVYRVPDGPKGAYPIGLKTQNDSVLNALDWYGLRLDICLDRAAPVTLTVTAANPQPSGRPDMPPSTAARLLVPGGKEWQTVTVPFASFDYRRGQAGLLKSVKQFTLTGHYAEKNAGKASGGRVLLRNIRLVRGSVLHLASAIRSFPAGADGTAVYPVTVTNCTDTPQTVTLALTRTGWEGMPASVSPDALRLPPGASRSVTVRVSVPGRLPGGARETQTLTATPQNAPAETMQFVTLRRLPSPYLVLTQPEWDAVRVKAARYDWARKALADLTARADAWAVPEVAQGDSAKSTDDFKTPALFRTYIERDLWDTAVAWKLTGDARYGEKVALFLRRTSDPKNGYPHTLHAVKGGIPQEGGFFEGYARAYDLLRDSGLLSEQDRAQMENTLRIFIQLQVDGLAGNGGVSNWSVFNLAPAAECALAVQDMASFQTLMDGPTGLIDQLRYGLMDDGWWYEMSLSYNLGVAEAYTNLGLAARPFGLDLLHEQFPASLTQNVGLRRFEYENFEGMGFGKFGPLHDNWVSIKKMWDGIAPYPDYRGVMFGMGDGHEDQVAGGRFEEAYYAYRDPAYAAIIKQGSTRDLLFGVPDLPADTPKLYAQSARSDNAGIAVLRSQTPGRAPREQIQASFKYGTHGGYHGHFDRINLNSLERYGISFFNPETSWYGYGSYLYKWWVQSSPAHNMVVVDGKMQEPKECKLLVFHSGPLMQAVAAETDARWSNPPYFGGYAQIDAVKTGDAPFVPVPDSHPAPGDIGPYSEPVRQRRLMVVTDDFVLLADSLQGTQPHTFDNLLHLRGAALARPETAQFLGHDAQFDPDPRSSGQFITNVNRYGVMAPALVQSVHRIAEKGGPGTTWNGSAGQGETGGASSLSEAGVLHMDEHILWPPKAEVRIGDYPESWNVSKKLFYAVQGDDKTLASGTLGAWILGSGTVDVDVTGVNTLTLSTHVDRGGGTLKTVFWGGASLVTADGKTVPLSSLAPTAAVNVAPAPAPNRDYAGGPVRIAGVPYALATPAEPQDAARPATLTFDLSGLGAVRFQGTVGGDWPVGDEGQVRKTVSVRTVGTGAQFLTLIEPYQTASILKSAVAAGPDTVRVELTDGRVQIITLHNLDGGQDAPVTVTLTESSGGKVTHTETTSSLETNP